MKCIYSDSSLNEALSLIPILQYNWFFMDICYTAWKDEIISARKQKISLREIAGVGTNYISEILSATKTHATKTFNAERYDNLIFKLRGKKKFANIPSSFNTYLLLHCDKLYDDGIQADWCQQNIKGCIDFATAKKESKSKIISDIRTYELKILNYDNKYVKTDLGIVHDYLLGINSEEYQFNEIHTQMSNLLSLVMDIDTQMVKQMSADELEVFKGYSEILYKRILAESEYRAVLTTEKNLLKKIKNSI